MKISLKICYRSTSHTIDLMSSAKPASPSDLYDEMFALKGEPRNSYEDFFTWFESQDPKVFKNKHPETSKIFRDKEPK